MDLCERLGMSLAELDGKMGAHELTLWMAKAQVDNYVRERMEKHKLSHEQAMDQARAEHRAVMRRKQWR